MLPLPLAKPGLQGGQRVLTPEGGSWAACGSSSLQILGSAHLYNSWVCQGSRSAGGDTGEQGGHARVPPHYLPAGVAGRVGVEEILVRAGGA